MLSLMVNEFRTSVGNRKISEILYFRYGHFSDAEYNDFCKQL